MAMRLDSPTAISGVASRLYRNAPVFSRLIQTCRPHICPFEAVLPWFPAGSSVLDVGCGAGLLLNLLARQGRITYGVGVDHNAAAVKVAQTAAETALAGSVGVKLMFQQSTAVDDWPREQFGVVSMIDVMHHVEPTDQRRLFHEALARLSPGGLLVYKDMCQTPLWRASANRLHDLVLSRQWIHYVPIRMVEEWAKERDFQLWHRMDMRRLWYGHELRVFRRSA